MATVANNKVDNHEVVDSNEWLAYRKELLRKEKEFTRLRDELSQKRRDLPWERVRNDYSFDGPNGKETLLDLFDGRSQLIVYHFMFGPGWEQGCPSCSFIADHIDGTLPHLANRDITLAVVSRAPFDDIARFRKRMGWRFHWVSSFANQFNYDFRVSFRREEMAKGEVYYNYATESFPSEEAPGASVFYKNPAGDVFHTYSTYSRGLDMLLGAYNYMDLTPKGRDEAGLPHPMAWVRHHDRYAEIYFAEAHSLSPSSDFVSLQGNKNP